MWARKIHFGVGYITKALQPFWKWASHKRNVLLCFWMYKPAPVEMTSAVDSVALFFFLSSAIIRILMILNRYSRVSVYSAGTTKVRILGHSTCGKGRAGCKDCLFFPMIFLWFSLCVYLWLRKKIFSLIILLLRPNQNEIIKQNHIRFQVLGLASAGQCFSLESLLQSGAGRFFTVRSVLSTAGRFASSGSPHQVPPAK